MLSFCSLVFVHDPTDSGDYVIPIGKQTLNPSHIFYTPCSGIWQSVWIESAPANHVVQLDLAADMHGVGMTSNLKPQFGRLLTLILCSKYHGTHIPEEFAEGWGDCHRCRVWQVCGLSPRPLRPAIPLYSVIAQALVPRLAKSIQRYRHSWKRKDPKLYWFPYSFQRNCRRRGPTPPERRIHLLVWNSWSRILAGWNLHPPKSRGNGVRYSNVEEPGL